MSASALVWGGWLGLFLALELAGLSKHVPWTSLSEWAWGLEAADPPLRWGALVGLATLLVHIVARWP
jgi:hypothetical protein